MTADQSGPLGRAAARGGLVSVAGQVARASIQLVSVVLLARLLAPSDYGLMAMVAVLVGVAEVFRDFGLSSAAVQAPHLSRAERSNLLWANTVLGASLALVFALAAPVVAGIFGQDELVDLTRAMAVIFLVNGVATQYRVGLTRRMAFGRLAAVDVAGPLVGLATALWLASQGAGYWALAAQQLVGAGVMLVAVVAVERWLPRLPRRDTSIWHFVRYGRNLVGSQLVGYAANNVDTFVIGVRFRPSDLGFYTRAFQLLMVPLSQARAPLTQVALPTLSRVQHERERLSAYAAAGQLALGYSFVVGLGLAVGTAGPLVRVVLGARWEPVTPLLALIAVAAMFQMLAFVGFWVYLATGLTDVLFRYSLVEAAIKVTCILVGSLGGVVGVAVGYAVAPALSWPLSLWWVSRASGLRLRPLYAGAARILLMTAATTGGSYVAVRTAALSLPGSDVSQLAAGVAGGAVAALVVLLVPAVRRDIGMLLGQVRKGP